MPLRIEMLNVGHFTSPAGLWRRGDDLDRQVRLPVPSYLIETADERILIDTGLHPAGVADAAAHYPGAESLGLFRLEQEASIAEQIDLATLTKVVMTHLHFDHAGGLALLPANVPVFIHRLEWEGAHDKAAIARNFYLPADYGRVREQIVLLDGDHDLLGDRSVGLLSTPGHTPGHQSIRIRDELVIGGDVSHYASGLDDHRFPLFADDYEAQAASAERLRLLRDAGADVRPGHDPNVLEPGVVL